MTKKHPVANPPARLDSGPTYRPDADIDNADWPKRGARDLDIFGNPVHPVAHTPNPKSRPQSRRARSAGTSRFKP